MNTKVKEELEMVSRSQENIYKLLVKASLYKLSKLFCWDNWLLDVVLQVKHGAAHWGFCINDKCKNDMTFLHDLEDCFKFDGVYAEIEKLVRKSICTVVIKQKLMSSYLLPNGLIDYIGSCGIFDKEKEDVDAVADFMIKNTLDKINDFFYDLSDYVIYYRSASDEINCDVIRAGSVDNAFEKFKKKYPKYKEGVDYTFLSAKKNGDDCMLEDIGMPKRVWSNSLEKNVVYGFYVEEDGGSDMTHYTWNDEDCLYYSDDVDGDCYSDVPRGAELDYEDNDFYSDIEGEDDSDSEQDNE